MPTPRVPDVLELLRLYLLAQPAVTAIVGDRIALSLSGTYPAIRYALIGGPRGEAWEYLPTLQVECWGDVDGDEQALRLALVVRDALEDLRGWLPDGPASRGYVAGAEVTGEPFASADPKTGRARYLVQVQLHTGWTPAAAA